MKVLMPKVKMSVFLPVTLVGHGHVSARVQHASLPNSHCKQCCRNCPVYSCENCSVAHEAENVWLCHYKIHQTSSFWTVQLMEQVH